MKNIAISDEDPSSCHSKVSGKLVVPAECENVLRTFDVIYIGQVISKMDDSATVLSTEVGILICTKLCDACLSWLIR